MTNQDQPKELDEILQAYKGEAGSPYVKINRQQAKQAILATHIPRSKVEEAIGNDTVPYTSSTPSYKKEQIYKTKNKFRAEIRSQLDLEAK